MDADSKPLILGADLGRKLLRVFGLEGQRVVKLAMSFKYDEMVTVEATIRVTEDMGDAFVEVMKRYALCEIEEGKGDGGS